MSEIIGAVISLVAAFFAALTIVYTRFLSQNLHNSVVGFYYGVGNLFFTPIWLILV